MFGDTPFLNEGGALKNRFGITDPDKLEEVEKELSAQRIRELKSEPLDGQLDFERLKATHQYIFQDVYEWAGDVRPVSTQRMTPEGARFQTFTEPEQIDSEAKEIFSDLQAKGELKEVSREDFAREAARLYGKINTLHPFREGNGRAQRLFLEDLAREAGYELDLGAMSPRRNAFASAQAYEGDYKMLERMFEELLDRDRMETMEAGKSIFQGPGGFEPDDMYYASAEPGVVYEGTFAGDNGEQFGFYDNNGPEGETRLLVGKMTDLKASVPPGGMPSQHEQFRFQAGKASGVFPKEGQPPLNLGRSEGYGAEEGYGSEEAFGGGFASESGIGSGFEGGTPGPGEYGGPAGGYSDRDDYGLGY